MRLQCFLVCTSRSFFFSFSLSFSFFFVLLPRAGLEEQRADDMRRGSPAKVIIKHFSSFVPAYGQYCLHRAEQIAAIQHAKKKSKPFQSFLLEMQKQIFKEGYPAENLSSLLEAPPKRCCQPFVVYSHY